MGENTTTAVRYIPDMKQYVAELKARGFKPFVAKKIVPIKARPAVPGETIETILNGQVETVRTAVAGDMVATGAKGEQYIISQKSFAQKYVADPLEPGIYRPVPEPKTFIRVDENIKFSTAWNEDFTVQKGGVIDISRLADNKCVGIDAAVFSETHAVDAAYLADSFGLATSGNTIASASTLSVTGPAGVVLSDTAAIAAATGTLYAAPAGVSTITLANTAGAATTLGSGTLGGTTTTMFYNGATATTAGATSTAVNTAGSAAATGAAAQQGAGAAGGRLFSTAGTATIGALLVGATLPYEDIYKFVNDENFRSETIDSATQLAKKAFRHPGKAVKRGILDPLWHMVSHPIDTVTGMAKGFKESVENNVKFAYDSYTWTTGNGLVSQTDPKTGVTKDILLKDHNVVSTTTRYPDGSSIYESETGDKGLMIVRGTDGYDAATINYTIKDGKREITSCREYAQDGFCERTYKNGKLASATTYNAQTDELKQYDYSSGAPVEMTSLDSNRSGQKPTTNETLRFAGHEVPQEDTSKKELTVARHQANGGVTK